MPIKESVRANLVVASLCFGLALSGTAYVVRGLSQLILPHSLSQAKDLRTNWQEEREFLHRISPYSMSSPYPPWTFPINFVFYWPGWPAVRIYWAVINLAALGGISLWAGSLCREATGPARWVMFLSVPAIAAVSTGVGLGQNAVVYTACVIFGMVLIERGWETAGGILLAVAASKITIALPFFLLLLVRHRWRALLASTIWIAGNWIATSIVIRQTPQECLRLWIGSATRFAGVDYGPVSLLGHAGLDANVVAPGWGLLCLGIFSAACFRYRRLPVLPLLALAATAGRLWTYHRMYDDFMMVMLLVACGEAWLRLKRPAALASFLAVGATLWLPPSVTNALLVQLAHVLIWIAATIALLAIETTDHQRVLS